MRRFHLIEFHEQLWMPESLRKTATDYLAHVEVMGRLYDGLAPVIAEAIEDSGAEQVIDLGSGGGGPWGRLHGMVSEVLGRELKIVLTDLSPSVDAYREFQSEVSEAISFSEEPVDMLNVPETLRGFRTLFSSFHHFAPEQAKGILRDAVNAGDGIMIVEGTYRSVKGLVPMFVVPLIVLLVTPLIRPVRFSRFFWTYLVPVAPILIGFDGAVSVLRTYTPEEMLQLAQEVDTEGKYRWIAERVDHKALPEPVIYLKGIPVRG